MWEVNLSVISSFSGSGLIERRDGVREPLKKTPSDSRSGIYNPESAVNQLSSTGSGDCSVRATVAWNWSWDHPGFLFDILSIWYLERAKHSAKTPLPLESSVYLFRSLRSRLWLPKLFFSVLKAEKTSMISSFKIKVGVFLEPPTSFLKVSCSPAWPHTQYVAEDDAGLLIPPTLLEWSHATMTTLMECWGSDPGTLCLLDNHFANWAAPSASI